MVRTDDLRKEARWLLNLFGFEPVTWDTDDETVGGVLAAQAASAILANQQERQLKTALRTRDRIGQAKGIIAQRVIDTRDN